MLETALQFREAGFAVHWLHPREKRPVGKEWQERPFPTEDFLRQTYRQNYNIGVRLGEISRIAGGYVHVLDLDIRDASQSQDAWEALRELFPDVDFDALPTVQSGSGGESRHIYFVSGKPFRSKKMATSEGKFRGADNRWHRDWEIELFGTGKQVAMPPSIHPDSGKPYVWLTEFDFDLLDFGIAPEIPAEAVEAIGVVEDTEYAYESREPLEFKPGQLERDLDLIPVSDLDYDDWLRLGQALHHQFGASDEGFNLWLTHSRRSAKHDPKYERTMRRKWRSFGRYRGTPVTMGTVRAWAIEARTEETLAQFDEIEDDDTDDLDDLLGGSSEISDIDADMASEAVENKTKLPWFSLLDFTEDKTIRPTLHNVELIVKNDSRLIGLPQLNEFTQETVQRTPPGHQKKRRKNQMKETRQLTGRIWEVTDTLNGEMWSSARDYAIRSILEAPQTQGGYGFKVTDRDLKAATVLAAWDNSFHPVREYLLSLKWDGVPRVRSLFSDYLGAPDTAYTRECARLMMTAGVARVFEPGCKWDYAIIIEGGQGKGKSTFIRYLGKHWFSELEGDFHDGKELVEKMQGSWIMEMPELSGFNRADVRSIKAFISRQTDKVRLAYEARAADFPRQCILIGSTNDREYLKDDTGGRRFLPMECLVDSIDNKRLLGNVDQLWAEAYQMYVKMRAEHTVGDLPLYMTDQEAASEAARLQESRRVESADDAMAGQIQAWLDRPIVSGDIDDPSEGKLRRATCLVQIWTECLGNDVRTYNQQAAQAVGRSMRMVPGWSLVAGRRTYFKQHGQQRFYVRGKSSDWKAGDVAD